MKKYFHLLITLFFTFLCYLVIPTRVSDFLPIGDNTIFQYFGFAMAKGDLPYINMFDHKGPIIFFINYLGYTLYGELGIQILYLICLFFFFYFAYKITSLFSKNDSYIYILAILFLIYVTFFEKGLGLEGYMLPFITYSFYVYLDYFINNYYSKLRLIFVGISFSIVFFTKLNMVGLWAILSFFVIIIGIKENKFKDLLLFIIMFLLGFGIIAIPIIAYFMYHGALYDMIYQSIFINFVYAGGSGIGKRKILIWLVNNINSLHLIFITLISSVIYVKNNSKNKKFIIGGILLTLFCLLMSVISKRPYLHYLIVTIPIFIPYIHIVINYIYSSLAKKYAIPTLTVALWLIFMSPITNASEHIKERNIDNSTNYKTIANYINKNSSPNDRIYSHKMCGEVYLHSDRLSSTKYFFIPSVEDQSLLIDDFKNQFDKNLPKYIVIDKNDIINDIVDKYLLQQINKNYTLDYSEKTFEIYKLKS